MICCLLDTRVALRKVIDIHVDALVGTLNLHYLGCGEQLVDQRLTDQ